MTMVSRRHTRRLAASRPPPLASSRRHFPPGATLRPVARPLHLPSPLEHRANLVPKRTRGSNRCLNRNMNRRGHRRARRLARTDGRFGERQRAEFRVVVRVGVLALVRFAVPLGHPLGTPIGTPIGNPTRNVTFVLDRSLPRALAPRSARASRRGERGVSSRVGTRLERGRGSILEDAFEFVPSASKRRGARARGFCGGGTRGSTRLRRLASFVVASMAFSRGLRAATLGEVQENAHGAPRAHGDGERLHASVDARGAGGSRAAISSRARARSASGIRRFGGRGGATRALWDRSGIVAGLLDASARTVVAVARVRVSRARNRSARGSVSSEIGFSRGAVAGRTVPMARSVARTGIARDGWRLPK